MNKVNRILGVVLVIQIALLVVVHLSKSSTTIGKLSPVVTGFDTGKVTHIAVYDATAATQSAADKIKGKSADKGTSPAIELVKRNDKWVLANYHNYPVEDTKVSDLLDKISGMRARGPVAHGAARAKQLDVAADSYQRKLVLSGGSGKGLTVFVGSSAGGRQVSVRLKGQDQIFGVSGVSAYGIGTDPTSWVDPDYFKVEEKDIQSFDVTNQSGTFTFAHGPANSWSVTLNGAPLPLPAGKELDVTAVQKIASRVSAVRLAEPSDPARKVDQPLATITVRMKPPASKQSSAAASDAGPAAAPPTPGPVYVLEVAKGGVAKSKNATGPHYYVHKQKGPTAALVRGSQLDDVVKVSLQTLSKDSGKATGSKAATTAPAAAGKAAALKAAALKAAAKHAARAPAPAATK